MSTTLIGKAILRLRPGAQFAILGDEITWLDSGQTQPTRSEIADEIALLKEEAKAPPADWMGFLEAMKKSSVFALLRGQARASVEANALATQLYADLQAAALGLPDPDLIQESVNELLPTLSERQVAEIQAGVEAFHVPLALR
jgi:hypothetical protein